MLYGVRKLKLASGNAKTKLLLQSQITNFFCIQKWSKNADDTSSSYSLVFYEWNVSLFFRRHLTHRTTKSERVSVNTKLSSAIETSQFANGFLSLSLFCNQDQLIPSVSLRLISPRPRMSPGPPLRPIAVGSSTKVNGDGPCKIPPWEPVRSPVRINYILCNINSTGFNFSIVKFLIYTVYSITFGNF